MTNSILSTLCGGVSFSCLEPEAPTSSRGAPIIDPGRRASQRWAIVTSFELLSGYSPPARLAYADLSLYYQERG